MRGFKRGALGAGMLLCAVGGGWLPQSRAQGADELPEMVVSANRFVQPGVSTPTSISVITRAEIEATGAQHLVDVLRSRGAVVVSDLYGDGSRAQVSMRGFGGNATANTLVLVDGRRINNNDLGGLDFNTVALSDVERIEIIEGSASVLFGDQAVGGVVNIITRPPGAGGAELELGVGSFNAQRQRLALSQRFDNGLALRLSGARRLSDNYRERNNLQLVRGSGQLSWTHSHGELFGEFQHIDENLQLPGSLFAEELAADRRQPQHPNDYSNTRTQIARAGLVQRLSGDWQVLAELTNRWVRLDNALVGSPFGQKRRVTAFTPRLVGQWALATGTASLTLGADWEDIHYRIESAFGLTDSDQNMESLYFQGVLPILPGVNLTGGVRQAWFHSRIEDSFSPGRYDDSVLASTLGLAWQPAPAWRMFLRYESNYRFPLIDELTQTVTPGLRTQRGKSFEGGVEWQQARYRAKLVLYRLDLEDEIDYDSARFANVNLPATRRTGLIAEAAAALLDTVHLGMEYGYVDAQLDPPGALERRVPFVPRHQGKLWADWRPLPDWLLYGELNGVSSRIARADYTNAFPGLPGYVLANVNLSYRWRKAELGLRVVNLLDKQYSDDAGLGFNPARGFALETGYYPAPGRVWSLNLRVEL